MDLLQEELRHGIHEQKAKEGVALLCQLEIVYGQKELLEARHGQQDVMVTGNSTFPRYRFSVPVVVVPRTPSSSSPPRRDLLLLLLRFRILLSPQFGVGLNSPISR